MKNVMNDAVRMNIDKPMFVKIRVLSTFRKIFSKNTYKIEGIVDSISSSCHKDLKINFVMIKKLSPFKSTMYGLLLQKRNW
jgi:hypothetical protein